MTFVFVRAPLQDGPVAVFAYLLDQGCRLLDCEVHRGPDGSWRGSGRVREERQAA